MSQSRTRQNREQYKIDAITNKSTKMVSKFYT